jgi:hypothetical protein
LQHELQFVLAVRQADVALSIFAHQQQPGEPVVRLPPREAMGMRVIEVGPWGLRTVNSTA